MSTSANPTPDPNTDSGNSAIAIEPLLPAEEKERQNFTDAESDPDFPPDWKQKKVVDAVKKGYRYYKKRMGEKTYISLRKSHKPDISLGLWSDEKEAKLLRYFPNLDTMGVLAQATVPEPVVADDARLRRPVQDLMKVPIHRVAIFPTHYIPTLNILRYYQVFVDNGFDGSFSDFINDVVTRHMIECKHLTLPLVSNEEEEAEEIPMEQQLVNKTELETALTQMESRIISALEGKKIKKEEPKKVDKNVGKTSPNN